MSSEQEQGQQQQQSLQQQTPAEWLTLGVSLAIVLGTVGVLTYFYFFQSGQQQPALTVRPQLEALRYDTNAYYLPVEVHNSGRQTASDVNVQVTLVPREGEPETIAFTVDFLAGGGTASSTLVFQHSPAAGTLSYALSFARPE